MFSKLLYSLICIGFCFSNITNSIKTSHQCKDIIKAIESHYGLPKGLLQAIAKTESNMRPWVICVGKKAISFKNQNAMINHIKLLIQNRREFYIGCMQLSYKSHRNRFKRWEVMTDPFHNIDYAAKMLVRFKRKYGSWENAVRFYHSGFTQSSIVYKNRIFFRWNKIKT